MVALWHLCFIREQDWTIGLCDGRVKLAEYHWFLGYWDVLFSAMVNIVHPNTDQLLRVVDGSLQNKAAWLKNLLLGGLCHSSVCGIAITSETKTIYRPCP